MSVFKLKLKAQRIFLEIKIEQLRTKSAQACFLVKVTEVCFAHAQLSRVVQLKIIIWTLFLGIFQEQFLDFEFVLQPTETN